VIALRAEDIAALARGGPLWNLPGLTAMMGDLTLRLESRPRPPSHRSPTTPWTSLRDAHSPLENDSRFPQLPQRLRLRSMYYHN